METTLNSPRRGLNKSITYIILIVWAITTIYPFIWLILNSFKPSQEILVSSFALPKDFTFINYENAFSKQNILRAYGNSLIISGGTMIIVLLFASLSAYGLTRFKFRGRKFIYSLIIGSLMFPAFATIIPVFKMIVSWDLVNTHLGVMLIQIASNLAFAIIVLMSYMRSIPLELEESAFMDGAGIGKIFFHIIIPLMRPALASVAIFVFLWSYNDLFTQMIILRSREMYAVSSLLNEISSKYGTDFGLMAASVILVVVPVLIVYMFMQKNIVKGLTAGAIKG